MSAQNGRKPAGGGSEDYVLSVGELLREIRRRLWLILLLPLVLAALTVTLASLQPTVYESTTTILVGKEQEESSQDAPVDLQSDVQEIQTLIPTVAQTVETSPVAQDIVARTGVAVPSSQVLADLEVEQLVGTQFIEISYQHGDPRVVRRVTSAVGTVVSDRVSASSDGFGGATVRVWAEASAPQPPASSSVLLLGLGALVVGAVLGVAAAFFLALLDGRWRSSRELESVSGVPNLGAVPEAAGSGAPEAYREIRTGLLYASKTPPGVVVVTSPGPSEGKSAVCAGLASALARAEKSTLVLDCNFHNPAMAELFDLEDSHGLVEVLSGERSLADVERTPVPGLTVVPAGGASDDRVELLSSGHFAELVRLARGRFDHVLMDAPSAEPVSDPAVLAAQADGVLLVIDAQKTSKESVRRALHELRTLGADVLGTVMNNVEAPKGAGKKPVA